jgi:hypothetical protein
VETQSVPAGLPAPADPTASKCVNSTDFVDIFPPPLPPFLSFATDSVTYFLVFLLSDVLSSGSRVVHYAFVEGLLFASDRPICLIYD